MGKIPRLSIPLSLDILEHPARHSYLRFIYVYINRERDAYHIWEREDLFSWASAVASLMGNISVALIA